MPNAPQLPPSGVKPDASTRTSSTSADQARRYQRATVEVRQGVAFEENETDKGQVISQDHSTAAAMRATDAPTDALAEPTATDLDELNVGVLLRRAAVALIVLVILSLLASWLFRDWLEQVGQYLIGAYGGRGVFTSVFFIDWFPLPTTSEPVYMLGVSSGMDLTELFISSAAGSVAAALGCYASGAVLDRTTSVGDWVRRKQPGLVKWVEERGFKGLALAALVPLPFAPMMWTAGIIGLPIEQVVVISLLRIPKTVFYLVIIITSWNLA